MAASVTVNTPAPADPAKPADSTTEQVGDTTRVTVNTDAATKEAPPADKAGERPSWLPEGFDTPEALAASYQELRTKMSQDGTPKPGEKPTSEAAPITPEAAREAVQKAGLDFASLQAEYMQNGELSPESTAALSAAGLSKETVDQFVAGQQALATQMQSELVKFAGGEGKMTQALAWAKQNLDPQTAAAFDMAIDSGDIGAAKLALAGVMQQYQRATGVEPRLVFGERGANAGPQPFENTAQVVEAMSDPKYASDPAFRAKVEKRLAATNGAFGVR